MIGYDEMLAELQHEAAHRPDLSASLELHHDVMATAARARVSPPRLTMTGEQAADRLQRGQPLLDPCAVEIAPELLAGLCGQIVLVAIRHRPDLADDLRRIGAWVSKDPQGCARLAEEYLRTDAVSGIEGQELDEDLMAFVLNSALHPMLRAHAQALAPLACDPNWARCVCPVCGGAPDMAALEKDTGARRLLCSLCDTEWHVARAGCPFCGCDGPATYFLADEGIYRLYVCDECRRYIKTVDLRETAGDRLMPVERILTMNMDLAAQATGYH